MKMPRLDGASFILCLAFLSAVLDAHSAPAQDCLRPECKGAPQFELQGAKVENGVGVLRIDVDAGQRAARLTLKRTKGGPVPIDLHLGRFAGGGDSAALLIGPEGGPDSEMGSYLKNVSMDGPVLDLTLQLPEQGSGTKLRGQLSVFATPGGATSPLSKTWEIVLAPPPPLWRTSMLLGFFAAAMIVLGIAGSTFSETWLDLLRRRHAIQERISDMRPVWLRSEPSWPPVIRVKAILKQAQDRSNDAWMTGGQLIDERLDQAERLLQLLRRARNVRMGFQDTPMPTLPWLVRFRARAILRRIMRVIGMEALDDESEGHFQAELVELEKWLVPEELPKRYAESVLHSIDLLMMEVRIEGFPNEDRAVIAALMEDVTQGMQSLRGAKKLSIEILQTVEHFAALKLLWERRDMEEYAKLIACLKNGSEISELFDAADSAAWRRLRDAEELEICTPQITGRKLEAFEPIRLEVRSGSRSLDMTHLFHYELDWNWKITLNPKAKRRWWELWASKRETILLTPTSTEPQVIQYAAEAGELNASVTLSYRGRNIEQREIKVDLKEPIEIVESETFRRWRALRGAEGLATLLTVVAALLVGLQSEYFGNPDFGSGQDFIHLFLWGFGTDKVKSFVTKIGARAPSAAAG